MKALVKLALISAFVISTSAMAHSEGRGKVDKKKILASALTSAKALTFKDKGMSIGKLDSSWNKVSKDSFELVEETDEVIVVKAKNDENNQTIFFKLSRAGKVLDVQDERSFKGAHGHTH